MSTIQFDLGGGASIALPADIVAQRLIENIRTSTATQPEAKRPHIGEYLAGQGGIYAGEILGDDGTTYGLVIAEPQDVGKARWAPSGERDLSEWDGLTNTNRLRNECPAAKLASDYEAGGHADFYLPSRREMMIALANVPHLFGKDSWYWTSTPRSEDFAWAVGFEGGFVGTFTRNDEFRVRPFRRLPI